MNNENMDIKMMAMESTKLFLSEELRRANDAIDNGKPIPESCLFKNKKTTPDRILQHMVEVYNWTLKWGEEKYGRLSQEESSLNQDAVNKLI